MFQILLEKIPDDTDKLIRHLMSAVIMLIISSSRVQDVLSTLEKSDVLQIRDFIQNLSFQNMYRPIILISK